MAYKAQKTANPQSSGNAGAIGLADSLTLLSNGKLTPARSHIPNSRHNWSEYLDAQKALDLIDAATHAAKINRPLNLSATIHFEAANLSEIWRPQDAVGKWLKLAGQWLGLRDVPCTFLWVMEHAIGTGQHVHILLHCPPILRVGFQEKGSGAWLRKAGMNPNKGDRTAIVYRRVGPRSYNPATARPAERGTYHRMLKGSLRYHLKGINPDQRISLVAGQEKPIAELLGIEPEYSEPIYGRRVSRSQNIGQAARSRYTAHGDLTTKVEGLSGGA